MSDQIETTDPKPPGRPAIAPDQKRAFIKALRHTGKVTAACRAGGFSRTHAYALRNRSAKFRRRWIQALRTHRERLIERLEAEAVRRGMKGVRKPVYQNGKCVGYTKVYSDRLLVRTLEATHPEKWSPTKRIEHRGQVTMVPAGAQAKLVDPGIL
ncbi:MAG TPA: hypothetical protein VFT74_03210, partial [Isosphaeraceae bacterium]|nr:hypothetical protein [Isosphaeraceae bacterium]